MALTPLQEIISRARQISPLNTQPGDPNQPDLDLHAKRNSGAVVLVNKPKSFDSGNSQVRVPVYSRDEMKDFPNITEMIRFIDSVFQVGCGNVEQVMFSFSPDLVEDL